MIDAGQSGQLSEKFVTLCRLFINTHSGTSLFPVGLSTILHIPGHVNKDSGGM